MGEGKWGRKKYRRIPKCEGDWQGRVPKRSLHPKTLQNKRFGAPNLLGISPKLFASALCGIHPPGRPGPGQQAGSQHHIHTLSKAHAPPKGETERKDGDGSFGGNSGSIGLRGRSPSRLPGPGPRGYSNHTQRHPIAARSKRPNVGRRMNVPSQGGPACKLMMFLLPALVVPAQGTEFLDIGQAILARPQAPQHRHGAPFFLTSCHGIAAPTTNGKRRLL